MNEYMRMQMEIAERRRLHEEALARARAEAEELARKAEEERLAAIEEMRKRSNLPWFGLSLHDL